MILGESGIRGFGGQPKRRRGAFIFSFLLFKAVQDPHVLHDARYFGWYWQQSQTWEAWRLNLRKALEPTVTPLP